MTMGRGPVRMFEGKGNGVIVGMDVDSWRVLTVDAVRVVVQQGKVED